MSLDLVEGRGTVASLEKSGPTTSTRYHCLDALRAVALLLGIFLHASLAYIPGLGGYWAIEDRSTSLAFGAFILVVHAFRLPVFFLIAGFFARLLLLRRGLAGFTRNRSVRILVPMVCGWFLVAPWLIFCWVWGAMKGGLATAPAAWAYTLGLLSGRGASPSSPNSNTVDFPLTHLWFLYYLLLVYVVFLLGRAVLKSIASPPDLWENRADRVVGFVLRTRWAAIVLTPPTLVILQMMTRWGIDTPDKSLVPHIPALLLYSLVFGIGWLLHRQPALLEDLAGKWRFHLLMGLAMAIPSLLLSGLEWGGPRPYLREIRLVYHFFYSLMMWSWILGLLGLFARFRKQESRFWRYLSDSSYWIYIVHLPIVVSLQVALAPLPLGCGTKFLIICAVSIPLLLASYHYLVRSTPVGVVLNGQRFPFRWLPWQKQDQRGV